MIDCDPIIETPSDRTVIWRYMDFTKFISLLRGSIYFSRLDKLGDPYESTIARADLAYIERSFDGAVLKKHGFDGEIYESRKEREILNAQHLSIELAEFIAQTTFASCWHINNHEHSGMWRLYLKSEEGVAVRTTIGRLKRALEPLQEKFYIAKIKYVDFERTSGKFIEDNPNLYLKFAARKRKSYEHEREVRVLVHNRDRSQVGLTFPVDLDGLIDSVFVSPDSGPMFAQLVADVINDYGYKFNMKTSIMNQPPVKVDQFRKEHPKYF